MAGVPGIYVIASPSGKRYVGSSIDMLKRWREHRFDLRRKQHCSRFLQNAWNKYGEAGMVFSVLLECSVEHLMLEEQKAIDTLKPEYNILQIAGASYGWKHPPEVCAVMSAKRRAYISANPISEESRQAASARMIGNTYAKVLKGRKRPGLMTEEIRKKISDTLMKEHSCRGVPLREEHKAAIGVGNRGKKRTPEVIEAIAARRRGTKQSLETKAKRLASYLATVAKRNELRMV